MNLPAPIPAPPDLADMAGRALAACRTANTFATYKGAYRAFSTWLASNGSPPLCRATVQAYAQALLARGMSSASVNLALSAIKLLVREASDSGSMDQGEAAAIETIRGVPSRGRKAGRWLSFEQAQALIDAPDVRTLVGLRDRATLALLIGGALRRHEAVSLTVPQLQRVVTREGARWALVDVERKHHHVQTIPIPDWTQAAVEAWTSTAGLTEGRLLRALASNGRLLDRMSHQNVWAIVDRYSRQIGVSAAPHDIRRTVATLEHFAGATDELIRQQLGHVSVVTTGLYLRTVTEMDAPACDRLAFRVKEPAPAEPGVEAAEPEEIPVPPRRYLCLDGPPPGVEVDRSTFSLGVVTLALSEVEAGRLGLMPLEE